MKLIETSYFSVCPTLQAFTNINSQILHPAHYGMVYLRWYYYMTIYKIVFHCLTVHFNSLNLIHQLMHFYIQ